ncbi:probable protein tilB homolog [Coccomyxa sp. Obi]|nr:probable protein tilB homolog [Coccomyxa sp. Obi]
MNFIGKASLQSVGSLSANIFLTELHLVGNPCTEWASYRPFVIASIPQLLKLDGVAITAEERVQAEEMLPSLQHSLRAELLAEGINPDSAALSVEDDSLHDAETIPETGLFLQEGDPVLQKNEGRWEFTLEESRDGKSVELDVAVGRFLDSSLIKADVQPLYVRLLIKGHLLQLVLPVEVKPGASAAQRSATTGNLLLTMPKENPADTAIDQSCWRQRSMGETSREDTNGNTGASGRDTHGQQCRDAVKFGIGQLAPSDGQSTSDSPPNCDDLDGIPPL